MAPRRHKAKCGDLIEFFRPLYQHWAVYVGNNDVVHLTTGNQGSSSSGFVIGFSSSCSKAVVKCENIWKVAGNSDFKINNYLDNEYKPRDPDVIVKEAREMVGKRVRYSVTAANCEHFATELRYGEAESRQVAKVVEAAAAVVGSAVPGTAAAGVASLRNMVPAIHAAAPESSEESDE